MIHIFLVSERHFVRWKISCEVLFSQSKVHFPVRGSSKSVRFILWEVISVCTKVVDQKTDVALPGATPAASGRLCIAAHLSHLVCKDVDRTWFQLVITDLEARFSKTEPQTLDLRLGLFPEYLKNASWIERVSFCLWKDTLVSRHSKSLRALCATLIVCPKHTRIRLPSLLVAMSYVCNSIIAELTCCTAPHNYSNLFQSVDGFWYYSTFFVWRLQYVRERKKRESRGRWNCKGRKEPWNAAHATVCQIPFTQFTFSAEHCTLLIA